MSLRWWRQRWKQRVWMPLRRQVRPWTTVRVDGFPLTVDLNDRALGRTLYLGDDHEP